MPKFYTEKKHAEALNAMKAEYDGRLKELQAALVELKEENRRLSAEAATFAAQKQSISEAIIAASEKRAQMRGESEAFTAAQKTLALQAAEKAQKLLEDVRAAYPDEADSARFSAFERRLHALFSGGDGGRVETSFDEVAVSEDSAENLSEELPDFATTEKEPGNSEENWDLDDILEMLGLTED